MAQQLDPNTNTRLEFTTAALAQPLPPNPDPQWLALNQTLKLLMSALIHHPAMALNKDQPFMTPAASRNRVYFVWDFVCRILPVVYRTPWDVEVRNGDRAMRRQWQEECLGRSLMSAGLILDSPPGMLRMMMASLGPEPECEPFGEEVEGLARRLQEVCRG